MSSTFDTVFVGYTTRPRDNWKDFAPEVKAPARYKDPEKIAAYIASEQDKQYVNAAVAPLQCEIDDFVMLGKDGQAFTLKSGDTYTNYLSNFRKVSVIGTTLMRQLLIQEMYAVVGGLLPRHQWLVRSLRDGSQYLATAEEQTEVYDPVHAITCTSTLDDELGLIAKAYKFPGEYTSAEGRAKLALRLSRILGAA